MLWGLEALRVFDDKLKQALSKINEGKTAMYEGLKRVTLQSQARSHVD